MSSPNFIRKMPTADLVSLKIGEQPVTAAFGRLRQLLLARAGRDVANLFAEPIIGGDDATISWYAEASGDPTPLKQLDSEGGQLPKHRLWDLLAAIDPLLDDPEIGPLLKVALWVSSADDLFSVGGHPVLTGWGFLPAAIVGSTEGRRRHFAATLGPYAPFDADRLMMAPQSKPGASAKIAAPAETAVVAVSTGFRPGWRSGAVALGLATLALLVLLVPGVLRYGMDREGDPVTDLTEQQRAINQALADKIASLKAGLDDVKCTPAGGLTSPPAADVPASSAAPGQPPQAQVPPPAPKETKPPPGASNLPSIESLDAFLDAAVVMVIGNIEVKGRQGTAQGSGFVIGPGLIVTNHHVVENMKSGEIFVVNHALGKLVPATVVAQTERTAPYPDFAVLKIDPPVTLPVFQLSTNAKRLMDILVVGYTGDLVERDAAFQALLKGDPTAVPSMDVAPGIISVLQTLAPGVDAIVHSAAAATHGNSGGPMVDRCGRVLGVHTYGFDPRLEKADKSDDDQQGDDSPYKVKVDLFRYAEATSTLIQFLDDQKIPYQRADDVCDPQQIAQTGPTAPVLPPKSESPPPPAPESTPKP